MMTVAFGRTQACSANAPMGIEGDQGKPAGCRRESYGPFLAGEADTSLPGGKSTGFRHRGAAHRASTTFSRWHQKNK